jgi:hypothetical protein
LVTEGFIKDLEFGFRILLQFLLDVPLGELLAKPRAKSLVRKESV